MSGRFLIALIALSGSGLASAQSGQPSFDLHYAETVSPGPALDAFGLQDQVFRIEMEAQEPLNAEDKKPVRVRIFDARHQLLHDFAALMRYRGSSSLDFPKKQYAITLDGKQRLPLLGLAAAEDFVLSAPYNDKSLVRDILAYNLSNLMGRKAPGTRAATASLKIGDGPARELGIHVLTEKNSGGDAPFFLQIDRVKADDAGKTVKTRRGTEVIIDFPKKKDLSDAHRQTILKHLERLEQTLSRQQGADWDALFLDQVDLLSAVDIFLLQELSRNVDAYRLSSPFVIDARVQIVLGPVWDFNLGFGNADYENGERLDGWRAEENGVWFTAMKQHPEFCAALKNRWAALRAGALSSSTLFKVIDQHVSMLGGSVAENFRIWPVLGVKLWPNPYWLPTHAEEILALKSWTALRAEWMDQDIQAQNCDDLLPAARGLAIGGTISVSNGNSPEREQAAQAFDNNARTKWLVRSRTADIAYRFADEQSYVVRSYSLTSANDVPGRDPAAWIFEGSMDGQSWEQLDSQGPQSFADRFETKRYTLANEKSFKRYRWRFLANAGDPYLQIGEIKLFENR